MKSTILVIDDESTIRLTLRRFFEGEGWQVLEAPNGVIGIALSKNNSPDAVILDLKLPDLEGLDVLRRIKEENTEIPVVVFTAYGTIKTAVSAMKLGAENFIEKPPNLEALRALIEKAVDSVRARRENLYWRRKQTAERGIIGQSSSIHKLHLVIDLLADNPNTTVLLQGESGVGKELVAREIHKRSPRNNMPFLDVNCAGLSENLLESELFGYEAGAFTDAKNMKRGLFEIADGGTVFLDEISEMALSVQAKLLRFLESRRFRRLGGGKDIEIDVRIIAATNRNLKEEVNNKRFRDDLYWRLNVFPIDIQPLRQRGKDIIILANHFLREIGNSIHKKDMKFISPETEELLRSYSWPGNVRELKNVIERALILTNKDYIGPEHFPLEIRRQANTDSISVKGLSGEACSCLPSSEKAVRITLEEMEKIYIEEVFKSASRNRSKTAKILGIARSTLQEKLKKHGIT